jgi:dCMP deaminase
VESADHHQFFDLAIRFGNENSHDPDTKVGCVAVTRDGAFLMAANRMADGVELSSDRLTRPQKYAWITHAERSLVYAAAKQGVSLEDATLYLPWHPCCDCAQAIVGAGFSKLVCHQPDFDDPRWGEGFRVAWSILKEGGVECAYVSSSIDESSLPQRAQKAASARLR